MGKQPINAGDAWEIAVEDGIEEEINLYSQNKIKRAFILGYMEGDDYKKNRIMTEVQSLDVTEYNTMSLKNAVMKIILDGENLKGD